MGYVNLFAEPDRNVKRKILGGTKLKASNDNHVLVSLNDAAAMTSLSRSMINRYREKGMFPRAVPLGERRVAFVRSEVQEWINTRIAARAA